MDFSHEQEQHVQVHKFLDEYLEHIRAAQADHSKFDPKKLKEMMEAASTVMVRRPPFRAVRRPLTAARTV